MPEERNTAEQHTATVRIMDRELKVKCPPDKVEELEISARYLDGKMRDIQNEGKAIGSDRIAVIAALNITHELLAQKAENQSYADSVSSRIQELRNQIEAVTG